MDSNSQYQKQLEYYEYVEKQRENYIDLSQGLENPNNSIYILAKELFNKSKNNLTSELTSILMDDDTEMIDIFCVLLELVLYGLEILSNGKINIFDLEDHTDDKIYLMKSYLKSGGFDICIKEEIVEDTDVVLYRDRSDYYCEIVQKPPSYLCTSSWCILNYRFILNKKFTFDNTTPIDAFKAFFISNKNKIFVINFKFNK